ncbi:Olfactory receptor 5M3, partial [Camelus dromedarius]
VWFSSNVTPKMLENLVSETKTISYPGCIVQCFFFIAFIHVEVFILTVMAFDSCISTLWTHGLYFCGNTEINHFYCADPALIKMALAGTFIKEDVWFSSNVTPKMLENLVSETKTISYPGCIVQCFFFIAFIHVEVFILTVMAFDRYLRSPTEESVEQGKVVAVFYTTVVSMLNPMIYNLRNKDVKEAMSKVIIIGIVVDNSPESGIISAEYVISSM